MSRIDSPYGGAEASGGGPPDPRRRRAASVTLRQGEARAQSVGDLMDPANKSLADALRIAYVLLQVLIGVMVVVFIFSGMQTIGASEVGVRTFLGKIQASDLQPGLHLSWPEPIGSILKVQTNEQSVELKRDFFPNLTAPEEIQLVDKGVLGLAEGGRDSLDPDTDGALLTADGSLVHTRWLVTYRRSNSWRSLERIAKDPDAADEYSIEKQIVTAAVRRGIVHAAATMTIDEVLYNQPDSSRKGAFRPVSDLAKEEAQKMLDSMDLGITIQQFAMKNPMPPRFVMKEFSAVQTAQADASKKREDAISESRQKLTRAAGEGSSTILDMIDKYGVQLVAGRTAEADQTLNSIQDLMLRKPLTIDGKPVSATVSGDVSRTLAEADQYRASVVSKAQADAATYSAKLLAFRSNPQVFLTTEWTDAYTAFSERKTLQALLLPPGLERVVLQINKDPTIAKMIEEEISKAEAEENLRRIRDKRQRELYQKNFNGTGMEGI
jgi:regulator of protease activity HflC (stomatin/prohibitin superfamily)